MLSIGEFSGMTGLSVKALRHYDEKGVLVPAKVDGGSGYRRYGERQVRAGVIVRELRNARVPLSAITAALTSGTEAEALTAHRQRVLEQRAQEDHAYENAQAVLRGLNVPVEVTERELGPQPFVARVIAGSPDQLEELDTEDADAVFGELFNMLQESGLGPSGTWWTTIRAGDRGLIEMLCCWPTFAEVDPEWGGPKTFVGHLPARTELVASWRPVDIEELPEGSAHPTVVALFDAIADRGIEVREPDVRQTVVGDSDQDPAVEVSVIIASSGTRSGRG